MSLIERFKKRFGKKIVNTTPQTDPTKPNFDIRAWQAEVQELEAKYPDKIDYFFPTGPAALLGVSDCVTSEQKVEQERRLAEWERQQATAKEKADKEAEAAHLQTTSHRRAS